MLLPRNRWKLFAFAILVNLIWLFTHQSYYTRTSYTYSVWNIKRKRDWHDNEYIKEALVREGPGEGGASVSFDKYRLELYKEYGYDAVLSDQISVNRSVPDVRPEECKNFKQLAQLPKAAIIVIFCNERLSVLLRTVYGIINRSPSELLHEIILVDDASTYSDLYNPLTDYLRMHLPTVRLIRLPVRSGLVVARMTGARAVSKESEVLIFLDSHMEVNYNWLPPLLEPIALNPMTCTSPALDTIEFKNFKYAVDEPYRGYFDWALNYIFFRVKVHEANAPANNFYEYVMCGGAIAIGTQFFWDLGGFDEGMEFWGGEQFELSFKVWMCGGELIQVPCSRMGHLFRDPDTKGNTNLYGNYTFLNRNLRRLVDVWMDKEHRQYVFDHNPELKDIDPGNLTDRIAIRDRLKCNSFSWMIENIMPDLKDIYPPIEPNNLASGLLRSKFAPKLCMALTEDDNVILQACGTNNPIKMVWAYNWLGQVRIVDDKCLENNLLNLRVSSAECSEIELTQRWYYDRKNQWIAQVESELCMVANVIKRLVQLAPCDPIDLKMKWTFTHMNRFEMDKWDPKLNWNSTI